MTPLDELARRAGKQVRHRALAAAPSDGPARVRRRLRRRRQGQAVLAAALAATALVAVLPTLRATVDRSPDIGFADTPAPGPAVAPTGSPSSSDSSRSASAPGLSATGLVLLFDDGYDGVLALDLDAGIATRRVLEGQRAGDQPFRLTRQGDALVVGVDEIHAVSIPTGESTMIGDATISVPGAEPDRVWLTDYPRGDVDVPPYRQVDLTGAVQLEGPAPDPQTYVPAIGIPGGLALESAEGVALWDAATGALRHLGTEQGWVSDSAGSLLVWCEGDCATLHLTEVSGEDREVEVPVGYPVFEARSARLSADGEHVAVLVGDGGTVDGDTVRAVAVFHVATGEPLAITPEVSGSARLAWSPDGAELFFASDATDGLTSIGRYLIEQQRVEFASLPGQLAGHDLVVLEREEAGAFVADGTPEECQARGVWTSGEAGLCGFPFSD